ncbi:TPA: site-2 protease family protein [Candidatus Nomurabacteria bacterium]|nr:MAG: Peptidase M50 [Parcubacteria bacterium RAAC4_OD1_1]HCY26090.1 site-2 protease family protein [Candidatus Nomurabacteria bacterium]
MIDSIFYVIILIMSVVVHEVAHGYTAYLLGDDTARLSGRLTLNPIHHLDLFGSVILPLLLVLSQSGFVIGWAKPVPYNPDNIKTGKNGITLVAISGILANLFLVLFFGLLIRSLPILGVSVFDLDGNLNPIYKISTIIVLVNLVLAIFNLIPIPPLDGSKILSYFIPLKYRHIENFLEKFGFLILILFIIFVWNLLTPIIGYIFTFITGFGL